MAKYFRAPSVNVNMVINCYKMQWERFFFKKLSLIYPHNREVCTVLIKVTLE